MAVDNIGSIGVNDLQFRWRQDGISAASSGALIMASGALFVSGSKLWFVGNTKHEQITSA